MQFGKTVGVACSSFAITNIDDMFVLVTFFSEASTSKSMTPLRIVIGQYLGFTIITTISLIGFGVSFLIPTEPIGFMGLVPILLGVWKFIDLFVSSEDADSEGSYIGVKNILKVASITLMNGGDNIGTYIPLFSQAKKAEIAVYVTVYYILVGVWCLAAFLVMTQTHILSLVKRYMHIVLPFLYIGLGVYIIINSGCYPWSIDKIDGSISSHPGKVVMSVVTTFFLLLCISGMILLKMRRKESGLPEQVSMEEMPQSPMQNSSETRSAP